MNKIIIGIIAAVTVLAIIFLLGSAEPTPTTPPATPTTTTEPAPVTTDDTLPEAAASETIVDIAMATPETSTLVSAVTAANLAETLGSEGPLTVFAPTNDAFARLPEGTVETLLEPENLADLQGVLTYHVVESVVLAGDLTDGMTVETVNGAILTINVAADGGVTINDSSTVITPDVIADNGVVHLIDTVLLPPTE